MKHLKIVDLGMGGADLNTYSPLQPHAHASRRENIPYSKVEGKLIPKLKVVRSMEAASF